MSYLEEKNCAAANPGNVWHGEFDGQGTQSQHLHFLVFMRNASASISMTGGGQEEWWGILYNPANDEPANGWPNNGPFNCGNACQTTITGNSGGGGPPLLVGQVVADNAKFTGNATFEIFYRPCPTDSDPECGFGPGVGLVE
jgi:hypothetical protein